jgi:hypothetical protein
LDKIKEANKAFEDDMGELNLEDLNPAITKINALINFRVLISQKDVSTLDLETFSKDLNDADLFKLLTENIKTSTIFSTIYSMLTSTPAADLKKYTQIQEIITKLKAENMDITKIPTDTEGKTINLEEGITKRKENQLTTITYEDIAPEEAKTLLECADSTSFKAK